MAALNTGSTSSVASLCGLPREFVAGVVRCVERKGFRDSESFRDLQQVISRNPLDHTEIRSSLECALERFWLLADPKWTGGLLCDARRGMLVGGNRQWWIDAERWETFLAEWPEEEVSSDS
jgi:hypothetical protein